MADEGIAAAARELEAMVGRRGPELRGSVSARDIARFAVASGDPSPIYRSEEAARAAGYEGIPCPPLLLTSESRVLASHMAQIVMVVEAETTTQHAVKEALHRLDGCRNVNLVYNKVREFLGEETYDYHYG